GRAHDERHVPAAEVARHLRVRRVDLRALRPRCAIRKRVADDAHARDPYRRRVRSPAVTNAFAERALVWPVKTHGLFVDDGDIRRLALIASVDHAARDYGNPHRLEVARRHQHLARVPAELTESGLRPALDDEI